MKISKELLTHFWYVGKRKEAKVVEFNCLHLCVSVTTVFAFCVVYLVTFSWIKYF